MNRRIRIMIVSDHPTLCDGLRLACSRTRDVEIVCEALSITRAVQGFHVDKPDVAIVDLQLPLARRVIRRLRDLCTGTPILALTTASKEASPTNGDGLAMIEVSKRSRSETR